MDSSHVGSSFIRRITAEALQSPAVNHPYLQAFRTGDFPNFRLALQDFAYQYGLYSERFGDYLSAVISQLSNPKHGEILLANLAEEQGRDHDHDLPPAIADMVAGHSHANLFAIFQQATGVDTSTYAASDQVQPGALWSKEFLQLCGHNQLAGVGAIGIGTELIVAGIYKQLLEGMRVHGNLTLRERVFFELHSKCDDEHAAQLLHIAEELASDDATASEIEYGARMAISMRNVFWDHMLNRARSFTTCAPAIEMVADLGYEKSL